AHHAKRVTFLSEYGGEFREQLQPVLSEENKTLAENHLVPRSQQRLTMGFWITGDQVGDVVRQHDSVAKALAQSQAERIIERAALRPGIVQFCLSAVGGNDETCAQGYAPRIAASLRPEVNLESQRYRAPIGIVEGSEGIILHVPGGRPFP